MLIKEELLNCTIDHSKTKKYFLIRYFARIIIYCTQID